MCVANNDDGTVLDEGQKHLSCVLVLQRAVLAEEDLLRDALQKLADGIGPELCGRVDLAVVAFGSRGKLVIPMTAIQTLISQTDLNLYADVPPGELIAVGLHLANDVLEDRKWEYKAAKTPYLRPLIVPVASDVLRDMNYIEYDLLQDTQRYGCANLLGFALGDSAPSLKLAELNIQRKALQMDKALLPEGFYWLGQQIARQLNADTDLWSADHSLPAGLSCFIPEP